MKAFIWKEWREKRVWAIPLLASTVGVVALRQGYMFSGGFSTFTPLAWLSIPAALIMGTSAYSSELASGTVDFAYSRPVSWKKILLAKMVVGLGIIVGSVVLAAAVYRLSCPHEYVRLLTLPRLAGGVGLAVGLMGLAYCLGLACSMALPGTIGGVLTLMVALGGLVAAVYLVLWRVPATFFIPVWLWPGWALGLACAGLLTLRFGLTLSTRVRTIRYAAVALAALVFGACLDICLPSRTLAIWLVPRAVKSSVSPGGEYALVWKEGEARPTSDDVKWVLPFEARLIRLSDGVTASVGNLWEYPSFFWTRPGALLIIGYRPHGLNIRTARMDAQGKIVERLLRVDEPDRSAGSYIAFFDPSPDNELVAVETTVVKRNRPSLLQFVDVSSMRVLNVTISIPRSSHPWNWISDREIEYKDRFGKHHIVRVAGGREVR